ncbi:MULTISPECIES: DNA polymerase III subunit beta [Prochlorococcus]|uniref:Beta sliding clamp n=1 Tax=Prochlorococcus marinus (strain SARG / CCMP1375 / SS120) TaxID=167539 RepID=Q7VEL1_PROMA|nr:MULTISPECIES: DNA polymerase III subunit beta [Prochlorococcus]AAP99047.1 DNA polymerase III beta subunit [Prochlorococcus marinus subsp. marinus str. CCMP1375]KGG14419.1 DNA polymerasee III beta subunit [Prochlorococcus marinus str. LG]KGG20237.1 DNA polymerasee III beta subunit [Prochlorococcus marinus str. SS2]KGG23820.1 DNA polymerasee III beta subunit [Prochlorococcus marinus str. SS35]KGG33097.1 DNA polymerasee III beta subunit [Prochlorococcus marinus str. SS51]
MKLVCSQIELNTALQLVSRAVATRPSHPVLANVLLTADAGTGKLSLTGFDLNLGIQTSLSASIESSGAITVPSKLFGEIISKLSSESSITLSTDDSSEQVNLKSKSGNYQVRAMSADDFPDLPMVENGAFLKVNANSFAVSLKSTLFASSTDEAKQILTGVNLCFEGNSLKSAATDGHRLAVLDLQNVIASETNPEINNLSEKLEVTLPSRSLRELERFLSGCKSDSEISCFYDQGQFVFISSGQIITTRTLDGNYPNYNQLIPDQFSNQLVLDKKYFIAALERIAVLAEQHNNVVKISTNKELQILNISADAQDLGSGSESIPIKYDSEDIQIAFNSRYLLEGLKIIETNTILLKFNAPTTPAIFTPNDETNFVYLVMPVQIRS